MRLVSCARCEGEPGPRCEARSAKRGTALPQFASTASNRVPHPHQPQPSLRRHALRRNTKNPDRDVFARRAWHELLALPACVRRRRRPARSPTSTGSGRACTATASRCARCRLGRPLGPRVPRPSLHDLERGAGRHRHPVAAGERAVVRAAGRDRLAEGLRLRAAHRRLPAEAAKIVFSHVDGFYGGRGGPSLRDALAAASGAPLAGLLDELPWRPTAAEVAAVRGADGGDAALRGATEYASWTLTHGHRINHLTILHNALGLEAAVPTLASLNARMIADLGFEFNKAGGSDGLTQGSVASRLEQSSTVADHIDVIWVWERRGCRAPSSSSSSATTASAGSSGRTRRGSSRARTRGDRNAKSCPRPQFTARVHSSSRALCLRQFGAFFSSPRPPIVQGLRPRSAAQ